MVRWTLGTATEIRPKQELNLVLSITSQLVADMQLIEWPLYLITMVTGATTMGNHICNIISDLIMFRALNDTIVLSIALISILQWENINL